MWLCWDSIQEFVLQEHSTSYEITAKGYLHKGTVNPLAPELLFFILAHPVYKIWIIQEPNKLALWNKLHFEEEKTESREHV